MYMYMYMYATHDTVYVKYFTKALIELGKVNAFLILQTNLDSKIQCHVKDATLFYIIIKHQMGTYAHNCRSFNFTILTHCQIKSNVKNFTYMVYKKTI